MGLQVGQQALTRIGVILAAKGGLVADVRVGDCLELLEAAADLPQTTDMHARSPLFYQLLHARGGWGEDAPAAIQVFSGRGQPSCEQLIDRYHIRCRPMRDVLVDYLRERQPSVDFSTLQHDAYLLGKLFWADLEAHYPGIDSLKLPRDVAAAWKQRVMTKTRTTATADGGHHSQVSARLDGRSVMTAVRAFYLDIAEWADDDPARWAPWAVRCPVSASDVSHKKDRSQRKSRMDQRTRERLPVLPTLTAWVHSERVNTAAVLHAAPHTPPGAGVHRRRADPAPLGDEEPDNRTGLGRRSRQRATTRRHLRRAPRLLDLGHGGGSPAYRDPDRGTDRAVPPQPDPIPAAGHRRADPTAADHPVQNRPGTAAGDLTRTGRRVVHHHRPDPRRPTRRAAGGVLRQERTGLQPAHAAAVPMAAPAGDPDGRRRRRCASTSTTP